MENSFLNYETARVQKAELEAHVASLGQELHKFDIYRDGALHLIPDEVKKTPEYILAKSNYSKAFAQLQSFNRSFLLAFRKEYQAERSKFK